MRTPLDAASIPREVVTYYTALDAGDDEEAAAAFAEDAVYIRPELDEGGSRSRAGATRSATGSRGAPSGSGSASTSTTTSCERSQSTGACFVEGVGVTGDGPFAVFSRTRRSAATG